jgi:hypothetical protein
MRKNRKVNYETVKHLFDAGTTTETNLSYFKIHGGLEPILVSLPPSAVHRLFRLGQAFNIRHLRYLEPNVKLIVGSTEMVDFTKDLARLKTLVNDEVTQHYADALLNAINAHPGSNAKHIAISTGDF